MVDQVSTPEDLPERKVPLSYWAAARRPLQILVFLLPLIVVYEIGLAVLLRTGDDLHVNTVEAHKVLLDFFSAFGIAQTGGLYLGGVVIVVVLLLWHVLAREPWTIDVPALGVMWLEALVLTIPLVVLSRAIPADLAMALPGLFRSEPLTELDLPSRMAVSVGAGLYEELLFRMLLIAVIHTLAVDVGKLPHWAGATLAIVLSAAAFTAYHPLDSGGPGSGLSTSKIAFYFLAGLYFGLLYATRGFGIVVGVHALYDIVAVATLPTPDPSP